MLEVPKQIIDLVERFERNIDAYRSQGYNETQVRREFVDPFFESLGWDVTNEAGYAEAYKDVIHEDAIRVGGATKAPDYCFRIGGTRKFFVEAKKPAISVKGDINPAYQLRRYAWSAKLPISILMDFEEFAAYDCRFRPKPNDKPSTGRILYMTYRDYTSRWEEIDSVFSKNAVLKGSFDKYAVSGKRKRGTSEVDAEFLTEIETWRADLARNLALRNPNLTVRDLNFAVQRTIDRIIFLRMCEDRGVEPYKQLKDLLSSENIYKRLYGLYKLADDKYNSGLFHFKIEKGRASPPDELTPTLTIDDKVLKDIIQSLYYPESPYEFSVLSADILGNVYEQFLGKVIRLTAGHQARIEDKPEVKKAGGVYYTPAYIVDYIVKNTVGKLCEGKTPRQIAKLRILDPACGSGSFLIGAYTYLLNYHRDWYVNDDPKKHTKEIYQSTGGQWFLTTQGKKRILLNNVYGVDIDSQAVEVTKLSLLLKVLEGENKDTLERQLKMWRERALPDLASNIKCGNSLIGPDFYDNQQMNFLNEEEHYRINVFDWDSEFPEIMKSGGFNAVIGTPPYVSATQLSEQQKPYFQKSFETAKGRLDSYALFLERGLRLTREEGVSGFIIPNKFLTNLQFKNLRNLILQNAIISTIMNVDSVVFKNAAVNNIVLTFKKEARRKERIQNKVKIISGIESSIEKIGYVDQIVFENDRHKRFLISYQKEEIGIANKFEVKSTPLSHICKVRDGIIAGRIKDILFLNSRIDTSTKPLIFGDDMGRYQLTWKGRFVNYKPNKMKKEEEKRVKEKGIGLRMRVPEIFETPKVITRKTADRIIATWDSEGYYFEQTVHGSIVFNSRYNGKFIVGILNSKLCKYYYQKIVHQSGTIFPQVRIGLLKEIPIRTINFSDPADKAQHDKMVGLVEGMLGLHKRLKEVKMPYDKTRLQRQIDATDKQIDQLVYELYGLTEEEIRIVLGDG